LQVVSGWINEDGRIISIKREAELGVSSSEFLKVPLQSGKLEKAMQGVHRKYEQIG